MLSCVVYDNTTNNAAEATSWFTNENPPVRLPDTMITNTRDGDVVTSVLTIESVSLNDNGRGCLCVPSFGIGSNVGVITVVGECEHLCYNMCVFVCIYIAYQLNILMVRFVLLYKWKCRG